jgi:hypothetical protein
MSRTRGTRVVVQIEVGAAPLAHGLLYVMINATVPLVFHAAVRGAGAVRQLAIAVALIVGLAVIIVAVDLRIDAALAVLTAAGTTRRRRLLLTPLSVLLPPKSKGMVLHTRTNSASENEITRNMRFSFTKT